MLKKLVLSVSLLVISIPAYAGLLDLAPMAKFAAEKIGETKATTIIDLNGKVAAGLLLPVWTFHTRSGINVLQLGVGGTIKEGGEKKAIASMLINLPGLADRILRNKWMKEHVTSTRLPPLWIGPYVQVPLPYEKWILKNDLGVMITIGLGGSKEND